MPILQEDALVMLAQIRGLPLAPFGPGELHPLFLAIADTPLTFSYPLDIFGENLPCSASDPINAGVITVSAPNNVEFWLFKTAKSSGWFRAKKIEYGMYAWVKADGRVFAGPRFGSVGEMVPVMMNKLT